VLTRKYTRVSRGFFLFYERGFSCIKKINQSTKKPPSSHLMVFN
jgi:hypothetical protein